MVPATTLNVDPTLKYGTTDKMLTDAINAHLILNTASSNPPIALHITNTRMDVLDFKQKIGRAHV